MSSPTQYDQIFYASKLNRTRHIDYIGTVARLYGLQPTAPFAARVIEIGCATGDALIPLAEEYPQTDFVGVDVSEKQIAEATRRQKELGELSNLTFFCGTAAQYIAAHPQQTFDYIICHGVFSWIPISEQSPLLSAIQQLLKANGICLLSYNTAPGSSFRKLIWDQIKDMCVRAQAKSIEKKRQIIQSLRSFVEMDFEKPYQHLVHQELSRLLSEPDHYLVHEVFSPHNNPIGYDAFISMLTDIGLAVYGDAKPHLQGIQRLMSAAIAEEGFSEFARLKSLGLADEALMDFAFYTPFRTSLLYKAPITTTDSPSATPSAIDHTVLKSMSFAFCGAVVESEDDPDLLTVKSSTGKEEVIKHPVLRAVIEILREGYPSFYTFAKSEFLEFFPKISIPNSSPEHWQKVLPVN